MAIPQKYEQYPAPAGTQFPHPLIPTRTNLITNPRVEVDFTGWTFGGAGGTVANQRISSQWGGGEISGGFVIQQVGTTGVGGYREVSAYWGGANGLGAPAHPGVTYTATCYIKSYGCSPAAFWTPQVYLRFSTLAGTFISQTQTAGATSQGAQQLISHTAVAPNNAAWVQPIFLSGGADVTAMGAVTINTVLSGFLLEEGSSGGAYFDGAMPGCWWEGATDASTSGSWPVRGSQNLVVNPSFQGGTSNWAVDGGAGTINKSSVVGGAGPVFGDSCMQIDGTLGASGYFLADGVTKSWSIEEGQTYTLSMYVNAQDQVSSGCNVGIIWFDSAANYISEVHSTGTGAGGPMRLSVTATAPVGARQAAARFTGNGSNGETYGYWVDGVLFEKASTVRPFFDGSTGQTNWSSTANASMSYQLSPGGMWIDLGSAVGGLGGLSKVEMKFPRTGVTYSAISRTPANRRQSSVEIGPGVQRSGYVLEKPFHDDFIRADEANVLQPLNAISGGTQAMRLLDHQLTATERGADDYGYAGSNFQLDLPMVVRVTLGSRATNPSGNSGWDEYLELGTTPFNNNLPESFEFGWFRRPGWGGEMVDNLDHYALWWLHPDGGGSTPSERMVPAPDAALGTAPMPGPPVKSGDQMALAYDGVSVIAMRKPVGLPWFLIRREPLSTLAHPPVTRPLFGGIWTANYIVDVGLNGIASFSYGRF